MQPTSGPSGEIDAAALNAIVRRFRAHHAFRIARTGERLISRHRRVLDALPMLYHENHAALPGYVGPDVPHGIAGFRPGAGHIHALRAVARGYLEPALRPARADLFGLYLMGSGGTVGQTRGSDVDLWVCCDSLLHAALWPKVRMIDRWAADLGLELHTFLVDPDALRTRGNLPGSRIPMLVLDEFYRTGALMAGRYPLWWLVAEEDPARYAAAAEHLLARRFVSPRAVIDFGPVATLPPGELAHAAIIELGRALATPHKSLLKLKLIEAYAASPELSAVSSAYRARIHAGTTTPLELDPYVLLYEHVERHLERHGRHDELAFVRTLLIGKAAESIGWQSAPHRTSEWSALLERFRAWGFDSEHVAHFRRVDGWTMRQRQAEHGHIIAALERGLELAESLVRQAARVMYPRPTDEQQRLQWLGETRLRQLRTGVDRLLPRDPHHIELLHPALVSRHRAPALQLSRDGDRWVVEERGITVRSCARLVEAVLWCELNGAILSPARPAPVVTRALAQVLQGFRGARRAIHVFVNAEAGDPRVPPWQPAAAESPEPAATLLTRHNDPLDYGALHQLQLATLDLVSRDESGHWRIEAVTDQPALLDALGRLLAAPPAHVGWQVLGGQERFRLSRRLEQLHDLARQILDAPGALFVLPFGADCVSIRRDADRVETRRHRSIHELQAYLQSIGAATVAVDPASERLRSLLG